MISTIAEKISGSSLSQAISGSDFIFPITESIHVLFLSVVFGSIAIVDLRLLNVRFKAEAVSDLTRRVLPVTWLAFIGAVITGLFMFIADPGRYLNNFPFLVKMLLLALAGLNMAFFHLVTQRNQAEWDRPGTTSNGAKTAGAASLSLWTLVIVFGRWIGFT